MTHVKFVTSSSIFWRLYEKSIDYLWQEAQGQDGQRHFRKLPARREQLNRWLRPPFHAKLQTHATCEQ